MDHVRKLLEKLEQDSLISNLFLKQDEIQSVLDQRDDPLFDDKWMKTFLEIKTKKGGNKDAEHLVSRLRELTYIQAYERWQSSELAACISDDFGLIGDALALGYSDDWLNGLLDEYLTLRFPHRNFSERVGRLDENL